MKLVWVVLKKWYSLEIIWNKYIRWVLKIHRFLMQAENLIDNQFISENYVAIRQTITTPGVIVIF